MASPLPSKTASCFASDSCALTGATIYRSPSEGPIRNGVVLVSKGKIAAVGPSKNVTVPAGVPRLDCRGATLTAAFWNSHVHFVERKWEAAKSIPASELGHRRGACHVRAAGRS